MMHIVQILEKTVSPGKLCESSNSPGGERCACVPRLYSCPKPWIAQEKKGVSVRDGIKDGGTAIYGKASSRTGEDCSRKKRKTTATQESFRSLCSVGTVGKWHYFRFIECSAHTVALNLLILFPAFADLLVAAGRSAIEALRGGYFSPQPPSFRLISVCVYARACVCTSCTYVTLCAISRVLLCVCVCACMRVCATGPFCAPPGGSKRKLL